MQLILNTGTTVDINEKMSLNEDNLEKGTLDVQSTVANGNIANGDIPNEDKGADDSNTKLEQVEEGSVKFTEHELEPLKSDDISCKADNELNRASDIVNGKDDSANDESVQETSNINYNTDMGETEINDANIINDASESEPIHEEQNDNVINRAVTQLNHENDIGFKKENDDIVKTEIELNNDNLTTSNIADAKECHVVPKEDAVSINTDIKLNSEVQLNDELGTVDNTADTSIETLPNVVDLDIVNEINSKNSSTNINIDENGTNTCNEDANPNITFDHGNNDTSKISEKEVIPMSNNVEENDISSVQNENIKSDVLGVDEIMQEIEVTENSCEASITTVTSNIDVKKENVLNTETDDKTEANVFVSTEKVVKETEKTDTSDENIDLIGLNIEKESEDVAKCVNEQLEDEKGRIIDVEEKDISNAGKDDTAREPDLMDVDESTKYAEVNLEANSEASAQSISDVNENSKKTDTVDCNVNVSTVEKNKSVNLAQDSTDDVIFNLDDDREQENEFVKPAESKSTDAVQDHNKPDFGSDDVNKIPDSAVSKQSDEIIDLDENVPKNTTDLVSDRENIAEKTVEAPKIPPVLKLSNTLDILSDDEDEPKETNIDSKYINIEDDDDVMLIDEETDFTETKTKPTEEPEKENQEEPKLKSPVEEEKENVKGDIGPTTETDVSVPVQEVIESTSIPEISEKVRELSPEVENSKPLLHEKFLKACKKNLSEMTRDELEEFCILKIVESVIDRSSLSEVKTKLKTLAQNIEEYSKTAKMLTKQNRDLQVVLKSVQEDQKKGVDNIVPLKITRSVGMQVLMTDKVVQRRKGIGMPGNAPVNKQMRNPVIQNPRPQKPQTPQIPVPRLVPANNPALKSPTTQQPATVKLGSPLPNGIKNPSPVQKGEKRPHNRIQSVTVDLTDDEPPAKVVNRAQTPTVPPVRLVPSQNLLAPPRPSTINSPRKVYIPISGPQAPNVRPGQTIMLKAVPPPGPRPRCPPPHMVRMPQGMRMQRQQGLRHPAPLPDCMKQYQPPNWKALPPAPDLKLAKVENGIVISWKIEGYQEDSYEEIASYQLYAYQETASPPNTALWKKIGDVKALPLPMACTLTQFMAGYKYYFAVRAVDIRSRLGPFSLPGSILLLNKM